MPNKIDWEKVIICPEVPDTDSFIVIPLSSAMKCWMEKFGICPFCNKPHLTPTKPMIAEAEK